MDQFLHVIEGLTIQQDFLWFLSMIAWTGLLIVAWRMKGDGSRQIPIWLQFVAIAELGYCAISFILMLLPREIMRHARLQDDLLLALPLSLVTAALSWGAWQTMRRWLALTVVAICIYLRFIAPSGSAVLLTSLNFLAAGCLWSAASQNEGRRLTQWCVCLLALQCLASPVGPIAFWVHEAQMWNRLPRIAPICAIVSGLAGFFWLWVSLAPSLATTQRDDELRRFGLALAGWLLIGFGLTALSGRMAKQSFEDSVVAQVRMGARLINAGEFAACLSSNFKLGPLIASNLSDGRKTYYAPAPFLDSPQQRSLRSSLTKIRDAMPAALWAHLITIRGGYLVSIAFDEHLTAVKSGFVDIHHETETSDLLAWAGHQETIRPVFEWGQMVSARVPILTDSRQMLGWLGVDLPLDAWAASQAQARFQALLLTGAGVFLGVLLFGLRRSGRERSLAVQGAAAAREAERLQAIFLAKVSHELRTPVQNILGYAELLQVPKNDGDSLDRIEAVRGQGRLMIRLVNDLLDLSAAQAGSFQLHERPCDLSSVVKDSLDGMWLRADAKGLILRVDVKCSSTEIVWCDPERFHQVVANLVSNAIKFTNSGWVKVSFAAIESSGKDQRYRLTVSDSGPGIAPGAQALLFKPFERLGAGGETEGSGLGLALTRMICSAMKGTLEVSSDGFSGSTLTAEFNLRSAAGYTFNRMPSPTLASTLPQPSRVLVVDDHKLVRGLFREWLEQAGILVTEASNGLEALKKINSEEPDVLLLDWSMPGLDGIQLTRRLRSMSQGRQRLRIVGVSAHAGVEERGKALAVGMDVFLLKPVDRMDLLMAVKGAVEQPEEDCSKRIRRTDFFRRQFLEDAPEKLRDLEMSASRGEFVRVVELAHDLTNAAFALQDKVLGDASAALETAARCQSPEIRKFASEVASAVRALEKPFVASIPAALPKRQIQSESTIP